MPPPPAAGTAGTAGANQAEDGCLADGGRGGVAIDPKAIEGVPVDPKALEDSIRCRLNASAN